MARRRQKKYNRKLKIANTGKPRRGVYKYKRNTIPRTIVSTGMGFPKKMLMTHKYREIVDVTSTLGVINSHLWRCNGMFDPSFTGTGHQPMYFDQMAVLYDHYVVIGSKIRLSVTPKQAVADSSFICGFVNDDSTITSTSLEAISEATQGKRIIQLPAGNNTVSFINMRWSAKKFFGGSILSNPELQGTAISDPLEQSTFAFVAQSSGGTITYKVVAEIEYIAVWKELKELASS